MTKAQLRKRFLRKLQQQEEVVRNRQSEALRRKVLHLAVFRSAKTVCCYVALPYEVQTGRLIEDMIRLGKRVVVPKASRITGQLMLSEIRDPKTDLAPGAFGVLEPTLAAWRPVEARELDLVLVPGLAFDREGGRLGHGYGYFDRFLPRLPHRTKKVGLAYRMQILDRLPSASHDFPVQVTLTA